MTRRKRARATGGDATKPTNTVGKRDEARPVAERRPVVAWLSAPVGLVILLAVIAYANSLRNGFVLDDVPIIVENPLIRDVGNAGALFRSHYWSLGGSGLMGDSTLYRPVTLLSYTVDHAMWG